MRPFVAQKQVAISLFDGAPIVYISGKSPRPGRVCYGRGSAGLGVGGWWPEVTGLWQEMHCYFVEVHQLMGIPL